MRAGWRTCSTINRTSAEKAKVLSLVASRLLPLVWLYLHPMTEKPAFPTRALLGTKEFREKLRVYVSGVKKQWFPSLGGTLRGKIERIAC